MMDSKYEIAGVLSLFSLAGLYFCFGKNKKSNQKQIEQKKQPTTFDQGEFLFESKCFSEANHGSIEKWSSLYSEFYFDKNLESRRVLDHLDAEGISVETIYKYSPLIAVDEYKKFTTEIRRRRRLIRTFNEDQYIRFILDYEQEIDELLERSRQQIIYECQIDPDEFSSMKVIFQAAEDLTLLIREAKKSLKSLSYNRKRNVPKAILQKIINEEISFIKSKLYERLRNKLQNDLNLSQDQILRIIQALIEDIIYEKFGYEKEQIEHCLNDEWKGQLQKELKELKKSRSQLESDIGNINLLSQQSDVESEKDRQPLSQGLTRSGANSSFAEDQSNAD